MVASAAAGVPGQAHQRGGGHNGAGRVRITRQGREALAAEIGSLTELVRRHQRPPGQAPAADAS
jgi:hypothetical protein